jgi:hypothetical protein
VRQKTELKVEEREDRGFGVTYEKKPEEKEEEEKPGPKRPKKPKKKEEVPMSP